MKYLKQFAIIVVFLFLGEIFNKLTGLPIPSGVVGMILLFLALNFKIIKLESIEDTATFLLSNILLFFVPVGVSLMTAFEAIQNDWWKILLIAIISTFLVMGFTSLLVQLLTGKKNG